MLNFYIFIVCLYLCISANILLNTREKSTNYQKYENLNRQKLLKPLCSNHLFYINAHVVVSAIAQIYMTWCAVQILLQLSIFSWDSLIGVLIISAITFVILIRRVLIMAVVKKSVLYL